MLKKYMAIALALPLYAAFGCAKAPSVTPAATICCAAPHALSTDRAATHGMLLFGTHTLYLSHLPMFHSPHDYQVILEVKPHAAAGDPQALYLQDKATTGTKLYTIVPEPFVLPDVVSHKRSFKATLFRGHFERGGQPIASGVTFDITRVVLFKKFDPQAKKPANTSYMLFGQGSDTYMAHTIVSAPDFDQVLQVQTSGSVPPAGQVVTFQHQADTQPVQEGENLTALTYTGPLAVKATSEIYRETGDLAE